jgi:hypothetical protein
MERMLLQRLRMWSFNPFHNRQSLRSMPFNSYLKRAHVALLGRGRFNDVSQDEAKRSSSASIKNSGSVLRFLCSLPTSAAVLKLPVTVRDTHWLGIESWQVRVETQQRSWYHQQSRGDSP